MNLGLCEHFPFTSCLHYAYDPFSPRLLKFRIYKRKNSHKIVLVIAIIPIGQYAALCSKVSKLQQNYLEKRTVFVSMDMPITKLTLGYQITANAILYPNRNCGGVMSNREELGGFVWE